MRPSLREALLGFAREVPHLDGHLFEVRRAGVTPHGQTHLVRGEGMPHHNAASTRGDLVVEFDVRFPETLTAEQQRLLRQALA
jgi:DnaJ-related protein SCJ1